MIRTPTTRPRLRRRWRCRGTRMPVTDSADALAALLEGLRRLPKETGWVEFKHNNDNPEQIGEYVSALANSAALSGRPHAYLVWGIEDGTHTIIGTTVRIRSAKKGN